MYRLLDGEKRVESMNEVYIRFKNECPNQTTGSELNHLHGILLKGKGL